ncbi:uncharacterized protein BYT42DRAFT_554434 [Radiomyces spectabilis]|uniref:uncharacterized protein n=1 Tax=Radiomyces spectabilis TaxID=64574 RepID=UPI00221FC67A|nr:uncharacterized protein BYT42DRAFT_554434 [Radiomyces spectabilis]KAI8390814.1 hypothetical protein BYT42DRAFT_554434 [Radiomyces spectabilis]
MSIEPMLHAPVIVDQPVPELSLSEHDELRAYIQPPSSPSPVSPSKQIENQQQGENTGEFDHHQLFITHNNTPSLEQIQEEDDFFFLHPSAGATHEGDPHNTVSALYGDTRNQPAVFMFTSSEESPLHDEVAELEEDDDYDHTLVDATFDLASRTFYATCHKFARQNYPEYRRRSAYSFLENWLLHSMYSKSQQILLGIPQVKPTVLLTGDDFMFTPPLMHHRQLEGDAIQLDWDDQEDDGHYDVDTEHAHLMALENNDVKVMATPSPEDDEAMDMSYTLNPVMMDENTWMGINRNQQKLVLHVVNADIPEDEYTQPIQAKELPSVPDGSSCPVATEHSSSRDGSIVEKCMEENPENDDSGHTASLNVGITMSPELVDWYRSANPRKPLHVSESATCDEAISRSPPAVLSPPVGSDKGKCMPTPNVTLPSSAEVASNSAVDMVEKSLSTQCNGTYQSLSEMVTDESPSATLRGCGAMDGDSSTCTMESTRFVRMSWQDHWQGRLASFSGTLVDTAKYALELAEAYADSQDAELHDNHETEDLHFRKSKPKPRLVTCIFRVWTTLFVGAETMLVWMTIPQRH